MPSRADVVAKAREYLLANTPFHHQGRTKGRGIDCVGLPLCIAEDLGISDKEGVPFTRYMYANYDRQPIHDEVLKLFKKHLLEKHIAAPLEPGDILAIRNPTSACHAAIVVSMPSGEWGKPPVLGIIHAYGTDAVAIPRGGTEKIVEHILDFKWRRRIAGVFTFPGVEK